MTFLRYFLLSIFALALTSSVNAQEVDCKLQQKFQKDGFFEHVKPASDFFAKGTVTKYFPGEEIQAANFVIFDSLANSLSYWNETQEPFVYSPLTNTLYTIKRGWADSLREPESYNPQTSKNNLFVRTSTDWGLTWADPLLVYDRVENSNRQARYPSIDIFKTFEGTPNEDVAIAYSTSLVDEASAQWFGYAVGVYLVKDQTGVFVNSNQFNSLGNDYRWGWAPSFSASDSKIIVYPKGGENFNVLGVSSAGPVNTSNYGLYNALAYFRLENLGAFNETIPNEWNPELYFTPDNEGRWNNLVGYEKSPTSDEAYVAIFGRLANDEMRSFQISKTTDEGLTWSQFEVANWDLVKNFAATIGFNPDSIFVDWGGKEFIVYGNNNYSVFFPLFEQNAERDPFLYRVLVELNYNNGVWTGYKVSDINAPYYYLFTRNESNQVEILSTVRSYEIQASATLDNQKVVVKWVEPDYIPVTDTTWTFYSSTIYYNARNINGGTWGTRRAIENPAGDTVFHKATWMPNVLPNDLSNIPIISLRTVLAPGTMNTFQKLYLDAQYVTVGHFDAVVSAEDNQITSSGLQLEGIYPNPAVGLAYASVTAPVAGDYRVEIFSVVGEKVKDLGKLYLNEGQSSISLNVGDMLSGAYYLTVSSGNMKATKLLNIAR